MKVRKVHFGETFNKECKRELLRRPDIPVCIRRTGNTVHTDFRPINKKGVPQPVPQPQPIPTPTPKPVPQPQPKPTPPKPEPTPQPTGKTGGDKTGAIIGGVLGGLAGVGAVAGATKYASSTNPFPEITDPAIVNTELGDATGGFQMAEEATQGFTTGFRQVSQAGLSSRAGAQTAVSEVEMSNFTPEATPYDIFNGPASSAVEQGATEQFIGELHIPESGSAYIETYATPEIIPATETALTTVDLGAGAEVATTAVAEGATAGLLGGATAVAFGAVATVGALGYFASKGLFDFNAQSNAFQKGDYNIQQEVATRQPPKPQYIPPPPPFASQLDVLNYLNARDKAQADYQQALADYNVAIASSSSQSP
jgi:hypothetical protein